MLTYTFAKGSGESLYEQLYDRIKADILTGRLAAGEKLPSKRTLADHLELSVITVKNAYEQLIAEGYIYSRERSGYFVSAMDWPLSAAAAAPQKISQLPPRRPTTGRGASRSAAPCRRRGGRSRPSGWGS